MSSPLLEVRTVSRTFSVGDGWFKPKRALRAVQDVSLHVERGEVLGLVGESGCGKTTLARMVLGLLEPSSGDVLMEGNPLIGMPRLERARRIQPVFQDPYSSLNPRKTVSSIIALPLRVQGSLAEVELRRRVLELMERVGLPSRLAGSYPNALSGGQRQRVAIARALITRPEIVICDEPTSALDVSVQAQILNLLQDLQRDLNLTYILISHNLAVVEHMANRVAVMYLGRIVEESMTAGVFGGARHPYTRALLASVLTPEPGLGVPDMRLGDVFPDPLAPPPGCSFHPRCPEVMERCRSEAPRMATSSAGRVECHLHPPMQSLQ